MVWRVLVYSLSMSGYGAACPDVVGSPPLGCVGGQRFRRCGGQSYSRCGEQSCIIFGGQAFRSGWGQSFRSVGQLGWWGSSEMVEHRVSGVGGAQRFRSGGGPSFRCGGSLCGLIRDPQKFVALTVAHEDFGRPMVCRSRALQIEAKQLQGVAGSSIWWQPVARSTS